VFAQSKLRLKLLIVSASAQPLDTKYVILETLLSANLLRRAEEIVTLISTDVFVHADFERQQAWSSVSGQEPA